MNYEKTATASLRGQPVHRFRFDNGLDLIFQPDRRAPICALQTWFGVGSRDEQPGATGIAHFFEHLMFTGTRQHPAGEFDVLVERVGGDSNAATWVDWTYYRLSLPARSLELGIELEAERMSELALSPDIIESERDVVLNERLERVDDDVDGFLSEELFRNAFPDGHPYQWPTIGWQADIEGLFQPALEAFYQTFYSPNNATLVAVGDVDEEKLLSLVSERYGHLAPVDIPTRSPVAAAHSRSGFHLHRRPVASDRLVLGYPSPGQGDGDWLVLDLLLAALTGGPSTRLFRELQVERQVASSLCADVMPFRDPGLAEFALVCAPDHGHQEVLQRFDDVVSDVRANGLPTEELDKAKRCALTDFWTDLTTCGGKAELFGHYQTTIGDFAASLNVPDAIAACSAADIRRVADRYLDPQHRTTVVAVPEDAP